jgi:hypothetical protein
MELVEAINVRFFETAMKELMGQDPVSLEKTNEKTNNEKVMRTTFLSSVHPDDFVILPTLPTRRGNSLEGWDFAKAINIETATERFPLG